MKAFGIHAYKQKVLTQMEVPTPTLTKDDVLVEIKAASINPIDFKTRDGKLKLLLPYTMPLILGSDFSGTITQVGQNVTRFKVGDNVYGRPQKNRIGTFAEAIAIHQDDIAIMPSNISFEEAASLPLVGLTSYQALHDLMNLQPNQKILIQAGAGGVGTFAIQLAKYLGAHVATTASPKGFELVTEMGADTIVNYREEDFETVLKDYDFVFDTLGGDSLKKAFTILKPGSKIVSVSGLPNKRFAESYSVPLWKKLLFTFATRPITALEKKYNIRYDFLFMKPSGEQLEIISKLVEDGVITPVIDSIYPFSETQQALDYAETGRAKGKVIISMTN